MLVESIVGIFAFDEQDRDVDAVFFPKNVAEIIWIWGLNFNAYTQQISDIIKLKR